MHRAGHYGAALLSYAPAAVVAVGAGRVELAVVGGLAALALSTAPDLDRHVPLLPHRGPTHSIPFVCLVGIGLAVLASAIPGSGSYGTGAELAVFAFVVGALATGSHLAADAITPAGIRPFWPVSRRRYALGLVTAANPVVNYSLFLLGLASIVAVAIGVTGPA